MSRHTPEGLFKQYIVDDLNRLRSEHYRIEFYAVWDQQAGLPDIFGSAYGRAMAIELKAEDTRIAKLQVAKLTDWHYAGAIAGVLREQSDRLLWYPAASLTEHCMPLSRQNWFKELMSIYLSPKNSLLPIGKEF